MSNIGERNTNYNIRTTGRRCRIDGPSQTYTDIWTRSRDNPREPVQEVRKPIIHRGLCNQECIVLPPVGDNEYDTDSGPLVLMRQDEPQFAYLDTKKVIKNIDHHGKGWGTIVMGLILYRTDVQSTDIMASASVSTSKKRISNDFSTCSTASTTTTSTCDTYATSTKNANSQSINRNGGTKYCFQMPTTEEAEYVSIKRLCKRVVQQYLDDNGNENPYKEIALMQELGDDIHVLSCLEALEDDKFLYIITPYCEDGSLMESIPWAALLENQNERAGYPEIEARRLFKQILEILQYLAHHGICHHDLSPDNFMFYRDRLVLIDFAMSLRIPQNDTGHRFLMRGQGTYGAFAYLAPEVFVGHAMFDGVYADLWSAAVTLYNMLTGYHLYRLPCPADMNFQYFVIAGGLGRDPHSSRAVNILRGAFQSPSIEERVRANLFYCARANLRISTDAKELLEHLLALKPHNRWSLQEALESAWVNADEK